MDVQEVEEFMSPEPTDDRAAPEPPSLGRWILETVVLVLVAFALAQALKVYVVQPYLVPTGSMVPTIGIGDRVLAEKITYRFLHGPRVGDVVVFSDPAGQHPQLIKRVIATEGQTVEIKEESVYVDGREFDEPYVYDEPTSPGIVDTPITIPSGQVWLMGDNRTNSADSRFFGPRPVSTVQGRAFWTYWPLSAFGRLGG